MEESLFDVVPDGFHINSTGKVIRKTNNGQLDKHWNANKRNE